MIVTRYSTSRELGTNPETFRHALERLEKKYEIVTTKKTNKYTVVQIIKWDQYQNIKSGKTNSETTIRPTKDQQKTTYIENRDIENRDIEGGMGETIENGHQLHRTLDYLRKIPPTDFSFLKENLRVTDSQVRDKADDLYNYCQAKDKRYKNYRSWLRSMLKKDYPRDERNPI